MYTGTPDTHSCQSNEPAMLQNTLELHGLEMAENGNIRWKANTPHHPRNWTMKRKLFDVSLIIFLDFFTTAISTAGTSASEQARHEYGVGSSLALFAFVSFYLLGQGLGGVVFPPLSESFGRKNLYVGSTFLWTIFCIIIAAVPSIVAVFVGRFVTGLLSAIPSIVVAGSIEDLFRTEARVWLVFAWLTTANLGLVVGSILGSYVSYSIGWRWLFYIAAVVTGITTLLLFVIRESRPSQLLESQLRLVRKETGDSSLRIQNPDQVPHFSQFLQITLVRPVRLLFTEPIVFMVSIMSAIAFGLIYLFTEALQVVYSAYGFSVQQTSLAFIPIGIGLLGGVFTRLYDTHVVEKRKRSGHPISPEDKLTGYAVAAPLFAVGLWIFAWTVPPKITSIHWIVSMLALMPVGFAINEIDCVLAGYLADSYTTFAASAFASLSLLRAVFSAVFPLFARQMFTGLGANYAGSVLAAIATFACPIPFVLLRYGRPIRKASKFARYSVLVYNANSADGTVAGSTIDVAKYASAAADLVGTRSQMELTAEVKDSNLGRAC